jgi:hypothetical protein
MGVDSGNSLTALYHERWPVIGGKPGTIFVQTVSNPFFPVFFSRYDASTGRGCGTGGAVPAQGGL